MDYKITNGTLVTCDKWGNVGRQISTKVGFAQLSQDEKTFLITELSGKVFTTDVYGNHIRTICEGAVEARFSGDQIMVRTKSSNELRDKYGNLIRRI